MVVYFHYHCGGKHSSMQSDKMPEKEFKFPPQVLQAAAKEGHTGPCFSILDFKLDPSELFLPKCHSYSNKATPSNSTTFYGPMGPFLFKPPQLHSIIPSF